MGWEPDYQVNPGEGGSTIVGWHWVPYPGEPTRPDTPAPPVGGNASAETPYYTGVTVTDSPIAAKSPGREKAKNSYLAWVKWKRQELQNLIKKYKTEYPKQIAAYETSALGALPEAKKSMWGGMYTNMDQRGLSDSSSFLGGAKKDLAAWDSSQKASIADTKQGMEASAQQAILGALGQPDYPSLYQNWVQADDQQNAYNFREWQRTQ